MTTKKFFSEEGYEFRKKWSLRMTFVATVLAIITSYLIYSVHEKEKHSTHLTEVLEYIVRASKTGIVIVDDDNYIVSVNDMFAELAGYKTVELVGRNVGSIIPMRYKEGHDTSYSRRVAETRNDSGTFESIIECSILKKDGTEKSVIITVYMVPRGFSLALVTPQENVKIKSVVVGRLEDKLQVTPSDVKRTVEDKLQVTPSNVLEKLIEIEKKMDLQDNE